MCAFSSGLNVILFPTRVEQGGKMTRLCVRVGDQRLLFSHWTKVPYAARAGTTTVAAIMIRSFLRGTIHFAKSRSVILTICVAAAATSMPAAGPNTIVKAVGFRLQLNG